SGVSSDERLILEIGQFDEITLYSAVALTNLLPDPERAIWRLAQSVYAWGRVATVQRLARTEQAEIKAWLLRGGFRNTNINEYLSYIEATKGELLPALSVSQIDDELLLASADILSALIAGGPAEQIEDYLDGPAACVAFLRHAVTRDAPSLAVVSG